MKFFNLPLSVLIPVVLNIITFIIYIFSGGQQGRAGLFTFKNLFVATVILTVISLFFVNIGTCWKTGKKFYLKRQYHLLIGQIVIAAFIATFAITIIVYLITNFISL